MRLFLALFVVWTILVMGIMVTGLAFMGIVQGVVSLFH